MIQNNALPQAFTVLITGASRGIGAATALRLAELGMQLVIVAKTWDRHPKLPGSLKEVQARIEQTGGRVLAVALDVRDDQALEQLMHQIQDRFGRLDALINNAGSVQLQSVQQTPIKRFDLMSGINLRAPYLLSQLALPLLLKAERAHIINIAPPISLQPQWFARHTPYTLSKYGLSLLTQGLAAELADTRIHVNALWPKALIATAAIEFAVADASALVHCRKPDIMADAIAGLLCHASPPRGQCLIDEKWLAACGIQDLSPYAMAPGTPLWPDLYIDPDGQNTET